MTEDRFLIGGRWPKEAQKPECKIRKPTLDKAMRSMSGLLRRKQPPHIVYIYDTVAKQMLTFHHTKP